MLKGTELFNLPTSVVSRHALAPFYHSALVSLAKRTAWSRGKYAATRSSARYQELTVLIGSLIGSKEKAKYKPYWIACWSKCMPCFPGSTIHAERAIRGSLPVAHLEGSIRIGMVFTFAWSTLLGVIHLVIDFNVIRPCRSGLTVGCRADHLQSAARRWSASSAQWPMSASWCWLSESEFLRVGRTRAVWACCYSMCKGMPSMTMILWRGVPIASAPCQTYRCHCRISLPPAPRRDVARTAPLRSW